MVSAKRYWLALHPDVPKPIGGVKQMHRLAEALTALGRDASIIQTDASFHPGWFSSHVKTIDHSTWKSQIELSPSRDIVVIPETFISAFSSYAPGTPKVIFNQNAHYTFLNSERKSQTAMSAHYDKIIRHYLHDDDLLHVFCVSEYDLQFLVQTLGIAANRVTLLPNYLETLFRYDSQAKKPVIAYMPRKNSVDSQLVIKLIGMHSWLGKFKIRAIHNLSQSAVAEILRKSSIFLSFGHPEGFGLPLAEAMACGCYCIGYSGLGGRELFGVAERFNAGQSIEYGDWSGFLNALREFLVLQRIDPASQAARQAALSKRILSIYTMNSHRNALSRALRIIETLSITPQLQSHS